MKITFTLNGQTVSRECCPERRLIDFLREDLLLTGTKEGCGEGECGACTVLLNGEAVNSCLILTGQIDGCDLFTIEGLQQHEGFNEAVRLHALQQAFIDHYAVQCGFCSSGMILSAKALLDKNPAASDEEIRAALSGNICRCSGYSQILDAVRACRKE